MDQKLLSLLQKLGVEELADQLSQSSLIDITYLKDRQTIDVTIALQSLLPVDALRRLRQAVKDCPHKMNLRLVYGEPLTAPDLQPYLLACLKQAGLSLFPAEELGRMELFDGFVTLTCMTQLEADEIRRQEDYLVGLLREMGIDVKFRYAVDRTLAFAGADKDAIMQEKTRKALVNQRKLEQSGMATNHGIKGAVSPIAELVQGNKSVVRGEVFKIERIKARNGVTIVKLWIYDGSDSLVIKGFAGGRNESSDYSKVAVGSMIIADITPQMDQYEKNELTGTINKMNVVGDATQLGFDLASELERVEFAAHTKMSAFDGVAEPEEYLKMAAALQHKSLGFADRNSVQAFPEIFKAAKIYGIKPIYGIDLAVRPDRVSALHRSSEVPLANATYVVFDLETTGLYANYCEIIEFGAVKVANGTAVSRANFFIKSAQKITSKTTELTGITQADVDGGISFEQAYRQIAAFCADHVLVAHNAVNFDMRVFDAQCARFDLPRLTNPVIDTLLLSRVLSEQQYHSLGRLVRRYGIDYAEIEAHRADYDAEILAQAWIKMIADLEKLGAKTVADLDTCVMSQPRAFERAQTYPTNLYVRNQAGLKALYELVSLAHTDYLAGSPRLPKKELERLRKNLLIANGPTEGDVWDIALSGSAGDLAKAIDFYDFILVAPPESFSHEISRGNIAREQVCDAISRIVAAAQKAGKPVVASSEPYYVQKKDAQYRDVYIHTKGLNGRPHRLYRADEKQTVFPDAHYYASSELAEAFAFLGQPLVEQIISANSLAVAALFSDKIKIIPDKLYAPHIEGVEQKLKDNVYRRLQELYGKEPPLLVSERVEKELSAIIGHGFAVVYWISHLLVKKSQEDGYLVGSRGSVGSSLVAYLLDITEVNPLPPHYVCKKCAHFEPGTEVDSGFDLEDKQCPRCQANMFGDGQDIPFETFLGFKGDKVPDIDLNFSGEYQAKAHEFIRQMFGADHAYRAGTISTVADKTAFGYVKGYFEAKDMLDVKAAEVSRLAARIVNVKRTTGQHPGGIIVIPQDCSVFDFTPYNYPADDKTAAWRTTHFQFEHIHDNVLKFDILGHDDPTALKMLGELTGVDPRTVPFHDPKVLSLFYSCKELGVESAQILNEPTGAYGLPEFGTDFVRQMLHETQPHSFADLVRISGLSHGTDVWSGNARELVKKNAMQLRDIICCRDDIMVYLIKKGLPALTAFKIMEDVRKGKGLTPDFVALMRKHGVGEWYIDCCNKIKYMFPKAHAAAYVTMAWRIAWYKLYHPLAYYAVYFSIRPDAFAAETIVAGKEAVERAYSETKQKVRGNLKLTPKEQALQTTFEICMEAFARGVRFGNIDINVSQARRFVIHEGKIIPPFSAVDGLGEQVAMSIVSARQQKNFDSIEDLSSRTKVSRPSVEKLRVLGVFKGLNEHAPTNSLFD